MEVYEGKLVIKGEYSKEGILLRKEELFVIRRRIHTFATLADKINICLRIWLLSYKASKHASADKAGSSAGR